MKKLPDWVAEKGKKKKKTKRRHEHRGSLLVRLVLLDAAAAAELLVLGEAEDREAGRALGVPDGVFLPLAKPAHRLLRGLRRWLLGGGGTVRRHWPGRMRRLGLSEGLGIGLREGFRLREGFGLGHGSRVGFSLRGSQRHDGQRGHDGEEDSRQLHGEVWLGVGVEWVWVGIFFSSVK